MIGYEMQPEVRRFVLEIQAKFKVERGNGKFSQQQAINKIIKALKELNESNPDKVKSLLGLKS